MIKTTRVFGSLQNNMKKKAGFLLSVIGCSLLLAGLTACNGDESAEKEAAAKIVAEQEAKDNAAEQEAKDNVAEQEAKDKKAAEDEAAAAKAESEEVPPEVQEAVDEYQEEYMACFPNGAPASWVAEDGFEDCLDGDPDGPYGGWNPCYGEPNWWDEEADGMYNQLQDCGDWGDANWDYCKPEPDWWNEEIDGVYPQIVDCGWEGFPPDEEGEELIVFDDLGGLTREAAEDRLSGSVPAFHFYDVNSAAWGFSDEIVFNRYILFLRDGIVVGYEIERLNGPLRFGENILLELPPPDAVCDDYSSLVGMTSDEAEQVLKDAGLNSDVEVLEGKQPHYSFYFTVTQGTGPRVEYPEPIVINVAQNEDCSPVFERPTYPIWIMISASVGEHPPEG